MDKRLLMICASANRPERLTEMLNSYKAFTHDAKTHLLVYISKDDAQYKHYIPIVQKFANKDIVFYVDKERYSIEVYNFISKIFRDYDYYGVLNDDHIIMTHDWDKELIASVEAIGGWGIAHANDLWPSSSVDCDHPSSFVMSGNIIKFFGYMVLPVLHHFAADDYLRDIVKPIDRLVFRSDVVIEHRHAHCGKASLDCNYRWVYSKEEMDFGHRHYMLWVNYYKDLDLSMLIKEIEREKI